MNLRVLGKTIIVHAWQDTVTRALRALRLDTIRSRVVAFAVLATLLPTLATTCVSYRQGRRALENAVAVEVRSASSETVRELTAWLDERLDDLRVTAASFVVADNVARTRQAGGTGQALPRLRDYLNSVRQHFADYDALIVLDPRGRVVTTTAGRTGRVQFPLARLTALRRADVHVGEAYWDATLDRAAIVLAVPIRDPDGTFLGALAAKLSLESVGGILRRRAPRETGEAALITDQGEFVITARASSAALMRRRLPDTMTAKLFDNEGRTVVYERADGPEVMGAVRRVPRLGWAALAEMPRAEVSRRGARLRNAAVLVTAAVVSGVGLLAFALGMVLVRPLERLTRAASKVAAGDLAVDLPAGGGGELGYLTRVFGNLVTRLREREGQGELERLSVTDALTGLYNRRHLVGTLANEVQRARRMRRTFSILLADVDHFKRYNDTHGHLAGDAALVKIAEILRKTTRGVDCIARYGGEEFLVMLLETTIATAVIVAERIRSRVEAEVFDGGRITVSIGVAEYPPHGDTPEELIASADAAMYDAKGEGRNRVVAAGAAPPAPREKVKPRRRKGEV